MVGVLTQFPLEAVGTLARQRLVLEMADTLASILTWIDRSTEVNEELTLLASYTWITLTGRCVSHTFAVVSTRFARFFTEINRLVAGVSSPAFVAVTFGGFPSFCRSTESIATASLANARIIEDLSFTECSGVA